MGHEDYLGLWGKFANLSSGCDSIQRGEADIKKDQVGFQLRSFLNRFSTVGNLTDDVQVGTLRKCFANKLAEGREILDQDKSC